MDDKLHFPVLDRLWINDKYNQKTVDRNGQYERVVVTPILINIRVILDEYEYAKALQK